MILLRELLDEYWHGDKPSSEKEEHSVWQTYSEKFAGRNSMGQVRYFKDRKDAAKFATGAVAAPHVGRPKPKKRAKRKERIQKYDVKPVTPYDPEKIH